VDVVHICSPPKTHEILSDVALEAGCHIYVEKPFAESAAVAERLLRIAEEKRLGVCAGHQLLFEKPARLARELVPVVGDIAHIESYFSFRPMRASPSGIPRSEDQQLLDILPHPVYMLLAFLESAFPGEPAELSAVEIGPGGTVHALVRRGQVTGTLVVTLKGRPIESYLRVSGSNGMLHADFVRGTLQRLLGPGTSTIDKILAPYGIARQVATGSSVALARRFLKRQRSFPGLVEIIEAFHASIRNGRESPITPENIIETTRICERVAEVIAEQGARPTAAEPKPEQRVVLVTGGTGFLGKEVARVLSLQGACVRILARREPPSWDRVNEAGYFVGDLGSGVPPECLSDVDVIVHCAAETAGGWEAHERNSIGATKNLLQAAASTGVRRIIHVSSMAVVPNAVGKQPLSEASPVGPVSRERGPYAWGKHASEELALELGEQLGLEVKVVRPGAIVDFQRLDPPGALGRRVGNVFVAVGSPREQIGLVGLQFAGRALAWMAFNFAEAPPMLNLLEPNLPAKRQLAATLRRSNPDLHVVWLPRIVLVPLSWSAILAQKALRPRRKAINAAKVFGRRRYDTSRVAEIAPAVEDFFKGMPTG
jgi:predicted dehydrogenase/nucleoside-diphosphate-sugar epimerase